jgi:hypothetical protein
VRRDPGAPGTGAHRFAGVGSTERGLVDAARFPKHFQLRDLHKALNADAVKKAKARGGSPAWLKDFAGQFEDPEYCSLSPAERGLLKDLRLLALRRGNKILNDEGYLRGQLRYSSRTRIAPKLHTLRAAGFLEAYDEATNTAANDLVSSRTNLDSGEMDSALEVEGIRSRRTSLSPLKFKTQAQAVWQATQSVDEVRVFLEGFTDDAAVVQAHLDWLAAA